MNILRILGIIIALIAGLFYLLFAYVMVGWGWSDGGNHWSLSQWVITLILFSVPFLFTFWVVYRCFCRSEMEQWEIFRWTVRPQALIRAVSAEVVALLIGRLLLLLVVKQGMAHQAASRVLLEEQTPLVRMRQPAERPRLPLSLNTVGIEAPDGKFTPVMFLIWPQPGENYNSLTVDLKAGPPHLKIYRGTNDIAANNHFLGELQIGGYSKSKTSLAVTVFFMFSEQQQLFAEVHEAEHNNYLEVKRVDTPTAP